MAKCSISHLRFVSSHKQIVDTGLFIPVRQIFINSFKPGDEGVNPYPTAFPYGNGMVLHFYQQQESSTTKTVHKVINKGLKAYV